LCQESFLFKYVECMSRIDCISNRNIRMISTYVESLLGDASVLFDGMSFPKDRYSSANDYFNDEDEWTTYDKFQKIFRKAKELVGDPDFYFNCGISSATLKSWGRFSYFIQLFSNPDDGIKRLPFFNKNFNDTKDIDIIKPPTLDKKHKKINAIIRVKSHDDHDANQDYIGDPYLKGIISFIPAIWDLPPAIIKQPLNEYDPEILFNQEEEFLPLKLNAKIEDDTLTIFSPIEKRRKVVGRKVLLVSDIIGGRKVFLGKFSELINGEENRERKECTGILITESLKIGNRNILTTGEIYNAPYFILDVTYDRLGFLNKMMRAFRKKRKRPETTHGMIETINHLREAMIAKNKAYMELEKANLELKKAKQEIDNYAKNLEKMVDERTVELDKAKEDLLSLNRDLTERVDKQVEELSKYNELRRYLSPHITERILSNGSEFNTISHRKLMTVFFSDIRGFSDLTDSLEPEEISFLLNNYLWEMTKLIHKYEGTLDKIMGDGIMVFFGDPVSIPDHAQRAVLLAIDMQRKADQLKSEWLSYGYDLNIGIGINTGYMTVGNIGSEFHKDYTVIGNQVNVAARLESMAKSGEILISKRTYSKVKDIATFEKAGTLNLKGIHSPVETYRVLYREPQSEVKKPLNDKASKEDWEYCKKMLPLVSRTFSLNIEHLEGDIRKTVLLGYLLFRIADTFEDTIYQDEREKIADLRDFSEIFKGDKDLFHRLKLYETLKFRWKESSDEKNLIENGHRVLRCYFDLSDTYRKIIDPLIVETSEGMSEFQKRKIESDSETFQLSDMKELEEYCYYVAGVVGVMLTKIFCHRGGIKKQKSELEKFQIHFGIALQLINIIKDYQKDIVRGWCYIPHSITKEYQIEINAIKTLSTKQRRGITKSVLPFIIPYLDSTLEYIKLLPLEERSIRMFCIIPFVLGYRTLSKIAKMEGNKISRQEVGDIMNRSDTFAQSNSLLEEDYLKVKEKFLS
jgi:farnesyl-diphosphate farnesyltransferase